MVAEQHVPGTEVGELQLAMWSRQFQALRDGDRFFYGNDPGLTPIRRLYGIDFRVSLGDVIARNTDIPRSDMARNVFLVPEPEEPRAAPAPASLVPAVPASVPPAPALASPVPAVPASVPPAPALASLVPAVPASVPPAG